MIWWKSRAISWWRNLKERANHSGRGKQYCNVVWGNKIRSRFLLGYLITGCENGRNQQPMFPILQEVSKLRPSFNSGRIVQLKPHTLNWPWHPKFRNSPHSMTLKHKYFIQRAIRFWWMFRPWLDKIFVMIECNNSIITRRCGTSLWVRSIHTFM